MDWRLRRKQLMWTMILFQAVILISSLPAAATDLLLSPRRVEIGTFFDGAQVSLEAEIPSGSEAVIEVMGNTGNIDLRRKGRRGGLWMSVGRNPDSECAESLSG